LGRSRPFRPSNERKRKNKRICECGWVVPLIERIIREPIFLMKMRADIHRPKLFVQLQAFYCRSIWAKTWRVLFSHKDFVVSPLMLLDYELEGSFLSELACSIRLSFNNWQPKVLIPKLINLDHATNIFHI